MVCKFFELYGLNFKSMQFIHHCYHIYISLLNCGMIIYMFLLTIQYGGCLFTN